LLLAELNLAQPAGFVFGHQLPGFRATPAAPNFYYRCLLVHPSTASRTAAREQMGCSNAYVHRPLFRGPWMGCQQPQGLQRGL
jgi:hypothetical protein